jgi:hypothetical protein
LPVKPWQNDGKTHYFHWQISNSFVGKTPLRTRERASPGSRANVSRSATGWNWEDLVESFGEYRKNIGSEDGREILRRF